MEKAKKLKPVYCCKTASWCNRHHFEKIWQAFDQSPGYLLPASGFRLSAGRADLSADTLPMSYRTSKSGTSKFHFQSQLYTARQ